MAVAAFRKSGAPEGFRGLKYVCHGASGYDQGWCLLSDSLLRQRLKSLVEAEADPRRRMKCFQSLLYSYWAFPFNAATTDAAGREGWSELRTWLKRQRVVLDRTAGRKPEWFAILSRHTNLLESSPCERYGEALLRGDASDLQEAMAGLAIPSGSWVSEEAVFAQMKSAVDRLDEVFKGFLPNLLSIATGKAEVVIQRTLQARCVALLVSRYSKCRDRPENMELREAAISAIGNPWLRRSAWDAVVVDAQGAPDGEAREMINSWLKRQLITDFFELLSADGAGVTRRLDYWLRFEPLIDDMWFALGANARARRTPSFEEFRARAKGRLLALDHTTADNDAFIMRIGEYVAVEFSAMGNAMYIFRWGELPEQLLAKLNSGIARTDVAIKDLKSGNVRHIHRDRAWMTWEQKFDREICPLFGKRPVQPPSGRRQAQRTDHGQTQAQPLTSRNWGAFSASQWQAFVETYRLAVSDRRIAGGALWVITSAALPQEVEAQLRAWGFRHKDLKGWWRD